MEDELQDAVTRSIDVSAPRERIWALLTEPRGLTRWWPEAAELEPEVGGTIRLDFGHAGVSGAVTRWEPPAALGFTWVGSDRPELELHVTFTIEDLGGGRSRVQVVHSGLAGAPADVRESISHGWSVFLPRLAAAA